MLRRISEPKMHEFIKDRENCIMRISVIYSSPNIIRIINSRMVKWEGHVTRMGEMRNSHKISVEEPERKSHSEDLRVDGRITLK
jgi:hypothetical protein